MTVKEFAYAKLNLGLDVIGRREDGYHELISVMQSISLCDVLYAQRNATGQLTLDAGGRMRVEENNLVLRAARAYFEVTGAPFGVSFRLEKKIPMQAGMGGGSADAAATLRALERLSEKPLGERALLKIAAGIGADVPFCLVGGTRICRGIGERMELIENHLPPYVVIAMSGEGVSTPAAFAALDQKFGNFAAPSREAELAFPHLIKALEAGDTVGFSKAVYNRFEAVIEELRPHVRALKHELLALGAYVARMSGSGPAVYGLFEKKETAARAAEALCASGATAVACEMLR